MGEYIIYYRGKIIGGIYDDRFLVKPVKSAIKLMPNAEYELPYDGAKEMLLVDNVDSKKYLTDLFIAMYDELPTPKQKSFLRFAEKSLSSFARNMQRKAELFSSLKQTPKRL